MPCGKLVDAPAAGWVFLTGALAITVLADWIRRATDQWSAPAAQSAGLTCAHIRITKEQITGSIISTAMLFIGISKRLPL